MSFNVRKWLIIFAVFTFFGLISMSGYQAGYMMDDRPQPFFITFVNEMTGTYTLFLLFPLLLFIMMRLRIRLSNWYWTVPLHLLITVVYGVAHTLLMTISRVWLYAKFDLGTYYFGEPYYRFLMEYHKQFLVYWLILATVYTIDYYLKTREREKMGAELKLKTAQLQSELMTAQVRSLKGQLQPHFLFNTLNMISSFMYDDVKKADKMMAQLSSMLRVLLDTSELPKVSLKHELDFLNMYLDIMRARFEDKLEVTIHSDASLQDALVPNLILQPLVENAIKHNDYENSDTTKIQVRIFKNGPFMIMSVSDNGPGFNGKTEMILGKGVGLSNTKERLFRMYEQNHRMDFSKPTDGGLQVTIQIPFEIMDSQEKSTP
ncbi:hypothetical protein F9K33_15100 [bacterium]|nr:MAG: hypothetical protein F9K33_15100 [bacterium]